MAKNTESINQSLFDLLRSRGYGPTMLDTSGKEIPVPEDAEVFQFQFVKDGKEYGTVTLSVDGLHKLVVYFGDDVANSSKEKGSIGSESWYQLLNHLKRFSQQHQLSFELKNTDHLKYDMAKRDHMKKQEKIAEGYYPMGKKASYNDNTPTVKMVIQHNREIQEGEQRYRNVARIFLENQLGERILAPTVKPGIASIYARHLAEGGLPHDDRWNHINSLCEEYQKMAGFVRATRNGQFNESAQRLVTEGINHYNSLRESLSKMRSHRGYNSYFESYTPPLMEDDSEETNLNELFVQETLDPRIESVMPILNKLQKKVAEMKEVDALSEWADSLIEGDGGQEALNPIGIPEGYGEMEEGETSTHKGGIVSHKGGVTKHQSGPGVYGGSEHEEDPDAELDKHFVNRAEKEIGVKWDREKKRAPGIKVDEVDTGEYDARKPTPNGKEDDDKAFGDFRAKLRQYTKELKQRQQEKEVSEDLDADQKRVGQLGPTEKVKNNNIGKLVGANENFINTVDQAVVSEGEGNFAKAIENLHGWYQHDSSDPDVEVFDFDDGEGGYYAQGTVEHNLKTGEITVDFEDTSGEYGGGSIKEKFNSIGDAMNVLRGITTQMRYNNGKAHNFDTLGGRSIAGSNDVYKTDRAGKKGTLTKSRMDGMKMSSPYHMRGGPKGVLPEEELSEMDKSQTPPGRDGSSGDSDAGKKEHYGKMVKPGDVIKKGVKALDNAMDKEHKKDVKESIQLDEGVMDSLNKIINKVKMMPGIQKFIGAAQSKKSQLIQALQHSANGKDLMSHIQQAVGGQQAVAEGWGQKIGGAVAASAGGGLMAMGADMLMRAYIAMGKPDLSQMANDPNGRNALVLVSMLVVLGALAMFAGGHQVKQGLEQDAQPMREGQEDLDAILRIVRK